MWWYRIVYCPLLCIIFTIRIVKLVRYEWAIMKRRVKSGNHGWFQTGQPPNPMNRQMCPLSCASYLVVSATERGLFVYIACCWSYWIASDRIISEMEVEVIGENGLVLTSSGCWNFSKSIKHKQSTHWWPNIVCPSTAAATHGGGVVCHPRYTMWAYSTGCLFKDITAFIRTYQPNVGCDDSVNYSTRVNSETIVRFGC